MSPQLWFVLPIIVLPFVANADPIPDIHTMPEKDAAAYCSGVLGQQSLLFLQLSKKHRDLGHSTSQIESSRRASEQLDARAKVLYVYGANEKITTKAYRDTAEAADKAKRERRNPVESFYSTTQVCFDFYKSRQSRPDFQMASKKALGK